MKKTISWILTLVMILSITNALPLEASAETEGIYTYSVSNGQATITDCSSSASGAITIPHTLGGYPVTALGARAFLFCESLTSITIPGSVTFIGDGAFFGCESLTSINVDENNANYSSKDGVLFNKNKTKLIDYPEGKTDISYVIPNSVTTIEVKAFYYCGSLTSITIPDSVTIIEDNAFDNCESLTSITIPNSVTTIGYYAFSGCGSLTSITIPNSVATIRVGAFSLCESLTSITIPNTVTTISDRAFVSCDSLTDVYYIGTEEEWNQISIGSSNTPLTNANIHFKPESTEAPSTNADLKGLGLSGIEEFNLEKGKLTYKVNALDGYATHVIWARKANQAAKVQVATIDSMEDLERVEYSDDFKISFDRMAGGDSIIALFKVTSESGTVTQRYIVKIVKPASADCEMFKLFADGFSPLDQAPYLTTSIAQNMILNILNYKNYVMQVSSISKGATVEFRYAENAEVSFDDADFLTNGRTITIPRAANKIVNGAVIYIKIIAENGIDSKIYTINLVK